MTAPIDIQTPPEPDDAPAPPAPSPEPDREEEPAPGPADPPLPGPPATTLAAIRSFVEPAGAWALFEHGTVVLLPDDATDPGDYARLRLEEDAAQQPGSAAGDFAVSELPDRAGWAVSSHDPKIFTVVPRAEIAGDATDVTIGVAGRAAHGADVDGGRVIHVEAEPA